MVSNYQFVLKKHVNNLSRYDGTIIISIDSLFNSPYLEIEYKGDFYMLKVFSEVTDYQNSEMDSFFTLQKIKTPTMRLNSYNELKFEK
jgi:hypothetical protein